jgi:hypothetical protein
MTSQDGVIGSGSDGLYVMGLDYSTGVMDFQAAAHPRFLLRFSRMTALLRIQYLICRKDSDNPPRK